MDPSDNFSQKKKKDLIAIAALFGILSEEKANRMTKPELIDFLIEQDRISKSSAIPSNEPTAEISQPAVEEDPFDQIAVSKVKSKKVAKPVQKNKDESSVSSEDIKPDPQLLEKLADLADSSPKPVIRRSSSKTLSKTTNKNPEKESAHVTAQMIDKEVPVNAGAPVLPEDSTGKEIKESRSKAKTKANHTPNLLASAAASNKDAISDLQEQGERKSSPKPKGPVKKHKLPESFPNKDTKPDMLLQDQTGEEISPITTPGSQSRETVVALSQEEVEVLASRSDEAPSGDTGNSQKQLETKIIEQSNPSQDGVLLTTESTDTAADHRKDEPDTGSHPLEKQAGHTRTKHRSVIIKPKNEQSPEILSESEPQDISEAELSREEGAAQERPHHRIERPKEANQEMLSGVLEIMQEGYGFLRRENYLQGQNDIFVAAQYIRRFNLRIGDHVTGPCRPKREAERYQALQYIKEVNGLPPEKMIRRPNFDRLTPIYPDVKYILETEKIELSTRIIDLIAPIGKGQRGMIVSPPKAGKTILLQKIANAISINNPESKLIVLLIDERPEEVTDMQRSINGEVVFSTFDKTPENHVRITELVLERAMRLVELGQDVVILLDSITRLSRAYNLTINPTGRTLSGGLDPGALYGPKRFFGAARNIENGGSLTIIATSLIDTGSRMDEVIFEEFKGTGNMEVYLDRKLSEKRIFPAIDINKSGTRREELLLSQLELDAVWTIRKALSQLDTAAVTEMIISLLLKTTGNSQFVSSVNVSFNDKATFEAMRGTRLSGNGSNQNASQQGGK